MASNTIDLKYVVDSTQLKEANRELNRTDDALRRTGSLANSSGKKMNKFGVAMQQTGYQVGDFLVQVQSGQNALVAFGQQATQLVGILPMFNSFMGLSGTALVGLSAGLGIAIPLVTAIGAAIMRTGKDAKSLAEEFEGLSEAIKGYETIAKLASASTKQLNEDFGNLAKEATFAIKELQALKLLKLDEEFDKIANAFTDVSEVSGRVSGNIAKNYRDFFGLKRISSEAIPEIINLQKSLEDAVSLEDKTQAATGLAEAIARITGGVNNMTQEQRAYYETVLSAAKELASISEEERKAASSGFKARQQAVLEGIEIFRSAQKRMREEEARTQAEIAKGYANSVGQAQTLKNATAQYQQEMIGVFEAAKSLREELGEAAYEALRLSGVDISSGVSAAAKEAAKLAANLNVSLLAAMNIKNLQDSKVYSGRGGDPRKSTDYTKDLDYKTVDELISEITSKGAGVSQQDPLAKLRERIKLDTELLGKTKERQEVERAIANSEKTYSKDAIDQAVAELEAYNQIVEKRQELQGIYDTAQSAFEDGFMAMVEGTKSVEDAFKDMARAIIKELYDVLVIQRMVGTFNAGSGSGTGIMGIIGGIFGKASGGTVQANQPYLVGEKGPELIVPRNRGHVMNADLTANAMGGGGDVYVTNNFTMSANGDDSVKKIIAQAVPTIVNASKQGIMDARRRGGAMKNTFG